MSGPSNALTPRRVTVIFVGLQLGMILSTLDGTIVATALPTIARELGDESMRSWVITAYLLAQVATMPIYGKLGDLYGRKRIYLFAIAIFTVGSVLCGTAQNLDQLLAFRALQGMGAGGLGVLAMAVVADIVPARQLGRWLGYQGALFAVASLIGPLVGGVFVDQLSWRWAFYINLPLAGASIAIVFTQLHIPYRKLMHAIDYGGAALLTSSLSLVVLIASIGGRSQSWGSPFVASLAVALVGCIALFVARERRAPEPVLSIRMLMNPVVRVAAALNLTSGALFASGIYFLPVFWQQVRHISPTKSGLLLVPFMFTTAFTTLVAGRRVERTGRYRRWPIVGGMVMIVGELLLTSIGRSSAPLLVALFGGVLGTGVGFVMQTSLLALQNSVEHRELGVATSTALLSRVLGSTLGAALLSAVLEARLPARGPRHAAQYAHAIAGVYVAALPVAVVALLFALRLQERPLRSDAEYASARESVL